MKNALIFFKRAEETLPVDYIKEVSETLLSGGIFLDSLEILPVGDGVGFKKRFSYLRDTVDNLIVLSADTEFDLKGIIAEELNTELIENENALHVLKTTENDDEKGFALMPMEATVIPNPDGDVQGFLTEEEEFTLVFLPSGAEEFVSTCENYVIPYFNAKYKTDTEKFTFKYFGDEKTLLNTIDDSFALLSGSGSKSVKTAYGDSLAELYFNGCDKSSVAAAKRYLIEKIGDKIYAEFDTSLGERLFDVLKLKNLKLSVAESFTGGRVVSAVISTSGASAFLREGIVAYSNESKTERLNVKEEDLRTFGAVSSKVAYQMAAGLLMKGDCDAAISTTGIAGPNSDNTNKPVGLNFIGIGTKEGVHVYKYELKGTREEITETAKNTALFLAIKLFKNL